VHNLVFIDSPKHLSFSITKFGVQYKATFSQTFSSFHIKLHNILSNNFNSNHISKQQFKGKSSNFISFQTCLGYTTNQNYKTSFELGSIS